MPKYTDQVSDPAGLGSPGVPSPSTSTSVSSYGPVIKSIFDFAGNATEYATKKTLEKRLGGFENELQSGIGDILSTDQPTSQLVKDANSEFDRLDQIHKQTAPSERDRYLAAAKVVQRYISVDPANAELYRERARQSLGFVPSQKLAALASEEENFKKELEHNRKNTAFVAASNTGVNYLLPDGTPDYEKMYAAGEKEIAREYTYKTDMERISKAKAQLELDKARAATPTEVANTQKTGVLKILNPWLDEQAKASFSQLDAMVNEAKTPDQEQRIAVAIRSAEFDGRQRLEKMIIDGNVTPEAAKDLRETLAAHYQVYKDIVAGGDASNAKIVTDIAKNLSSTEDIDVSVGAPKLVRLRKALGDQGFAAKASVLLNKLSGFDTVVSNETLNLAGINKSQALDQMVGFAAGERSIDQIDQALIPKAIDLGKANVKDYIDHPEQASDLALVKSFGNSASAIITGGLKVNDQKQLRIAGNIVNKPRFIKAIKDTDNKMGTKLSANAFDLNEKALSEGLLPRLTQGDTGDIGSIASFRAVYNPETGMIEIKGELNKTKTALNLSTSPVQPPKELSQYVAEANQTLEALVDLKEYSTRRIINGLDEMQMKQYLIDSANFPSIGTRVQYDIGKIINPGEPNVP